MFNCWIALFAEKLLYDNDYISIVGSVEISLDLNFLVFLLDLLFFLAEVLDDVELSVDLISENDNEIWYFLFLSDNLNVLLFDEKYSKKN